MINHLEIQQSIAHIVSQFVECKIVVEKKLGRENVTASCCTIQFHIEYNI